VRFLLRPAWLALSVAVIGFVVACFTVLAPWQFGREAERDSQQAAIDASYRTPPVPLDELAPAGAAGLPAGTEWRQVTVTGSYLPDTQAVVRLRVVDGKPAVEVLTALRTDSGRLVLVDRGTVAAQSGAEVPAIAPAPAGPVTLTGRLRGDQPDPDHRAATPSGGNLLLYTADSAAIGSAAGLALEPFHVLLSDGQPGVLEPVAVEPDTTSAPFTNLSYALQWITFGVIALFALTYFIRLEVLQRQGRRKERADIRRALAGDDD
jgi:cytochrome oxidase assembly protein ShyY1